MPEAETNIGVIEKNKTSELRGRFAEYHGRRYFDLRTFVTADASGDRVPTRKGITLALDRLPELRDLIDRAVIEARAAGLLDQEDAS